MKVQKIAVSAVMMGAIAAGGLGLAGTASATPQKPHWDKPVSTISHQKTVTVTKTTTVSSNGQVGNGNTTQTASGNAGAIANVQLGVGALSIPLTSANPTSIGNTASATGGKKGADATASNDQLPSADVTSVAKNNSADNSTKVNNANGNGNDSSVSIGN